MATTFDEIFKTQLQSVDLEESIKNYAVGFIKNDDSSTPLMISLEQIHYLSESKIQIFMERGYGESYGISDLEYTERGAQLIDESSSLFSLCNMIIKYEPFEFQELVYLRNNQVLLSTIHHQAIHHEMALLLNHKKTTALGINYIEDKYGHLLLKGILENTFSNTAKTIAIGVITSSIIMSFTYNRHIRQTIQLNPEFLQSIYCYMGEICNRTIAEYAKVPWKDIMGLCWDWN